MSDLQKKKLNRAIWEIKWSIRLLKEIQVGNAGSEDFVGVFAFEQTMQNMQNAIEFLDEINMEEKK